MAWLLVCGWDGFAMINYEKLKHQLELMREFLHGAHLATNDENSGAVLHMACHKIDDILLEIKP